MNLPETVNTEAAILARILEPEQPLLAPEAARVFLALRFPQSDLDRMHELAIKNQDGELTEAEQLELEAYRCVCGYLDLLSAKARLALKSR
jgi:hypothetical protein